MNKTIIRTSIEELKHLKNTLIRNSNEFSNGGGLQENLTIQNERISLTKYAENQSS